MSGMGMLSGSVRRASFVCVCVIGVGSCFGSAALEFEAWVTVRGWAATRLRVRTRSTRPVTGLALDPLTRLTLTFLPVLVRMRANTQY